MLATFKLYSPVTTAIRDVTFIPFGFFFFFFKEKKKPYGVSIFNPSFKDRNYFKFLTQTQYQKVED